MIALGFLNESSAPTEIAKQSLSTYNIHLRNYFYFLSQ